MAYALRIRYQQTATVTDFFSEPGPAIALDGYVAGRSVSNLAGTHVVLDHHCAGRLQLPATCEQAALLRAGGWQKRVEDATVHLCVNDSDPDVSLSVWALTSDQYDSAAGRELLRLEGEIDRRGGAVQLERDTLERLCWVFEPWAVERVFPRNDETVRTTIEQICARADDVCSGEGGKARWAADFEIITRWKGVAAAREHGPLARMALAQEDIDVLVAVRDEGTHTHVSVIKLRDSPHRLDELWPVLNALEGGQESWGGGDTVGGSPRSQGTHLDLDIIIAAIARCDSNVARPQPTLFDA